jgi:hypothetical protein
MPVSPKRYPKELFLAWTDGQWVLSTPRGKHKESILREWNGAQHPLPLIIEAAKTHAAKYPEGAQLSIHRGKGYRIVEIIPFPPHDS